MASILELMNHFRKLKAERDTIDQEIKRVKVELEPAVKAIGGKWTDDQGYARIIHRKESVSYAGPDVDRLATTWSQSDDSIMQACGKMLLDLRKEKAGFSYLQAK